MGVRDYGDPGLNRGQSRVHEELSRWLEENPDFEPKEPREPVRDDYSRLKTQDSLDLHGLTKRESEAAIDRFLAEAKALGLRKVLVIHGKGRHSSEGPVLMRHVRRFLSRHPGVKASGPASKDQGGDGASWVVVG